MDNITQLTNYISAAAGLGTAAFALVDGCKVFGGGPSNLGFQVINDMVQSLIAGKTGTVQKDAWKSSDACHSKDLRDMFICNVLRVLHGNWINGKPIAEQKAIAKTLIKLAMTKAESENSSENKVVANIARFTDIAADKLAGIAGKISQGEPLKPGDQDAFGRADLMLTAIIDGTYQRADQIYRNGAKFWAMFASVVLALVGQYTLQGFTFSGTAFVQALLVGVIATPIAPIAKDLTSGLTAAVKVLGLGKK